MRVLNSVHDFWSRNVSQRWKLLLLLNLHRIIVSMGRRAMIGGCRCCALKAGNLGSKLCIFLSNRVCIPTRDIKIMFNTLKPALEPPNLLLLFIDEFALSFMLGNGCKSSASALQT